MNFSELDNPIKTLEDMVGKIIYIVDYIAFDTKDDKVIIVNITISKAYMPDRYRIFRSYIKSSDKVQFAVLVDVHFTKTFSEYIKLINIFLSEEDARNYITNYLAQNYIVDLDQEIEIKDYTNREDASV